MTYIDDLIAGLPEFIVAEKLHGNVKLHCATHGTVPAPCMANSASADAAALWLFNHLAEDHGGIAKPEFWNRNLRDQGWPSSGEPGQTVILSADAIEAQRNWSERTFGPGWRNGTVEHLEKECQEIRDAARDAKSKLPLSDSIHDLQGECIDALILALDLCWRSGMSGADTITAYFNKRQTNAARTWPDWRGSDPDRAIEHDRSVEPKFGDADISTPDDEENQIPAGSFLRNWRSGKLEMEPITVEEFQEALRKGVIMMGSDPQVTDLSGDPQSFAKVAAYLGMTVQQALDILYARRDKVDLGKVGPTATPTPYWAPKEDLWMGKLPHEWVIRCFGAGDSGQGHAERWAAEAPDENRRIWSQPPPAPGTSFFSAEKVPATTRLVPVGS